MSLVEYPDSDDEQHTARTQTHLRPAKKRKLKHRSSKKLPPLPSSFNDLYPASARIANTDDPDLHGGRIRSVPHVQGNWSAHVYLECSSVGHDMLLSNGDCANLLSQGSLP